MKSLQRLTATGVVLISIFATVETASSAPTFRKVKGGTLHVSSGVTFPSRVGAFRFVGTKVYGSAGRDVGAEYNVQPVIRGDVYVYPLGTYGKNFNTELRVQQDAIKELNKAVKLVSQSRLQVNQAGRSISGVLVQYELTRSLFRTREKPRRCGSQLYLFRDGPWLVACRFSYPIEQTGPAQKQIADFLRLWQWRAPGTITRLKQIPADGRRS